MMPKKEEDRAAKGLDGTKTASLFSAAFLYIPAAKWYDRSNSKRKKAYLWLK